MKGKFHGRVPSEVASSTMAYAGNSFKYSPKLPTDEPEQKMTMFDVITATLQSGAANTTSSVFSNRVTNGSVVPSSTGKTRTELSKDVSDAGSHQNQSTLSSQKFDEINSLSEDDSLGSGGQNQKQLQTEKVIVEVLQTVEKNIQEIEHSCSEHNKEVKNGPKKYKN